MPKGQTLDGRGYPGLCILLTALGIALLGCGSARPVLVETGGGVVAIPSNREPNREKALEIMSTACPAGYEIVREQEVPVGSRVRGEETTSRDIFDDLTTTTEYTVKTKYEWHIHYRCR